jgi:molybdopterin synthase catalytic subunit
LGAVAGPDHGGLVLFAGTVRDTEDGAPISSILYEAYERMAAREMEKIAREARRRWDVRLAVRHRVGRVWAGEPAFIVAASGRHRPEAFAACRFVVDRVKSEVPIWKVDHEKAPS